MFSRFHTKRHCPAIVPAVAAVALALVAVAAPANAGPRDGVAASEMLQDGLDAIGEGRPDLASKIFETLQATYPGSAEARRAADALRTSRPPSLQLDESEGEGFDEPVGGPAPRKESRPMTAAERTEYLRAASRRFLTEVGDRVFFAEDSAAIGGRARAVLEAQARWLKRTPGIDVTVIGRADDGSSASDAVTVSHERAKAVEAMLIANGVPPQRIKIEARGSSDPIATCRNALCQAQNRHAESLLRLSSQNVRLSGSRDTDSSGTRSGDAALSSAGDRALAR